MCGMGEGLDPASVVVGAAIPGLLWIGAKLFRGVRNHAHRDSSVRGFKVGAPCLTASKA